MGIESDRMVMDYLSEVGDLAQQRQLPPRDRTALVSGLRNEIDRRRATHGEESPTAVRGILGDLGTPDEVVSRAGGRGGEGTSGAGTTPAPAPASERRGRTWWSDTGKESGTPPSAPPQKQQAPPPAVPRPRGWWQGGPDTDFDPDAEFPFTPGFDPDADPDDLIAPGFIGGVEAPELFLPPEPEAPEPEAPDADFAPVGRARRLARLLRRRRPSEEAPEEGPGEEAAPGAGAVQVRTRGFGQPFLLLAALLLVAGAAFGWLLALAGGWLIAYGSRRLTPAQVKRAVFVLPGVAAAGGIGWLWGRLQGRWGEPVPAGALDTALAETWPWTLRAAALLSALYLLHQSRRL
ncbi:hypothetical protein [Streptomyces sp. NPDC058486]|uniref:hypothetical protein n=1 Tax=unclassified Streptomyces TaxID=2593676 RepID=UPI0036585720